MDRLPKGKLNCYSMYVKDNFHTVQNEYPDEMPQQIMSRLSDFWNAHVKPFPEQVNFWRLRASQFNLTYADHFNRIDERKQLAKDVAKELYRLQKQDQRVHQTRRRVRVPAVGQHRFPENAFEYPHGIEVDF